MKLEGAFHAGSVIFCDTCMTFCPDFCINRTQDGYEVDLDYCKGCGICAQECPRDVIDLIQEGS